MAKSKLTDAQVAEIRRLFASKTTRTPWGVPQLASAFGVSKAKIRQIVSSTTPGKTYMGMDGAARDLDSSSPFSGY